jgi:hypothetical protein
MYIKNPTDKIVTAASQTITSLIKFVDNLLNATQSILKNIPLIIENAMNLIELS